MTFQASHQQLLSGNKDIYLFSTASHPDAISIPSLEIEFFKPKIDFSSYEYLLITSKQALKALENYDTQSYRDKKLFCISQATANAAKVMGLEVVSIAKGYGDSLISTLHKYPKATKYLYLRGEVVASDFVQICQTDGYSIDEAIVYKSECSKALLEMTFREQSIFIFTSPSAVQCFLKNHTLPQDSLSIVIGKTTAKSLPKETLYTIAPEPSIEACVRLAKTYQAS